MKPMLIALPLCLVLGAPALATTDRTLTLRASDDHAVVLETRDADGSPLMLRADSIVISNTDRTYLQTLVLDAAGHVRLQAPAPRVRIGVTTEPTGEALASQLALDADALVISDVVAGLPAETAGLQRFDIVTHIDGTAGVTQQRLREAVRSRRPGEHIRLRVVRRSKPLDIEIRVEASDEASTVAADATDLLSSYEGFVAGGVVQLRDPYRIEVTPGLTQRDVIRLPTTITSGSPMIYGPKIDVEMTIPPVKLDLLDDGGAARDDDPIGRLRAELAALRTAVERMETLVGNLAGGAGNGG